MTAPWQLGSGFILCGAALPSLLYRQTALCYQNSLWLVDLGAYSMPALGSLCFFNNKGGVGKTTLACNVCSGDGKAQRPSC